jgi:hypothetical protein
VLRGALVSLVLLSPNIGLAEGGLWVEGSVGLRRSSGTFSYTDEANPGYGVSGPITLETDLIGNGVAIGGRLGFAGSRYWAVGAGPSVSLLGFGDNHFGASNHELGLFGTLAIDARFRPLGDGFVLGPSLGWTRASFATSTNDIGSADNIYEAEALNGPELRVVGGWTHGLLGVSLELGYQHLSSEHGKYRPVLFGVSLVLQHWDLE